MKMRKVRKANVFNDLGFSPEEATALKMKSTLHSKIILRAKGYRQNELQKIFDEPQPRISDLLTGKISKFSLETLIGYAQALNLQPEITIHEPVSTLRLARA
jgi:predicted XRE-type DNA-binding protein